MKNDTRPKIIRVNERRTGWNGGGGGRGWSGERLYNRHTTHLANGEPKNEKQKPKMKSRTLKKPCKHTYEHTLLRAKVYVGERSYDDF